MRKLLATLVLASMMLIALPLSGEAHPGCRIHRRTSSRSYASQRYYASRRYASQRYYAPQRSYSRGYYAPAYSSRTYYTYQRPSFYRRHRNMINMGIATGAGAILGGLLGGRRGAGLGALVGAGSGALYTYKINPKRRRY